MNQMKIGQEEAPDKIIRGYPAWQCHFAKYLWPGLPTHWGTILLPTFLEKYLKYEFIKILYFTSYGS